MTGFSAHTAHRHTVIGQREQTWYPEPRREALLMELHALATDPPRHRTRSIAIVAEANGGKSTLIKRYLRLHPRVRHPEYLEIPAIYLKMTPIPRVEDLSIRLLEAIDAPDPRAGTHPDRLHRFHQLRTKVKLGLVFLDEFHDCADTSGRGKPFLRCIKALINEGVLVVPVGTEELAEVLRLDPQLNTRFNFSRGRLPRLTDKGVVKALMVEVSGHSEISDAAVKYVLKASLGVIGHMLDLVEGSLVEHGNLKLESLRLYRETMDGPGSTV